MLLHARRCTPGYAQQTPTRATVTQVHDEQSILGNDDPHQS
jgi:hypothetical protein